MAQIEMLTEARNWRVESFRATAFRGVGETVPEAAQIWEAATGLSPEQVSSRPRENIYTAEGNYENNALSVNCRLERVDLSLRPVPSPPNIPIDWFATIGPFSDRLPLFLDATKRWLRTGGSWVRLAFGSVLLMETESVVTGNETMSQLLPDVHLNAAEVLDFFYQVNRRRKSTSVNGEWINRLSKWSVIQGGAIGFVIGGAQGLQLSPTPDFFACRLELDVNTVGPQNHPIPKARNEALFEELASLAAEIAAKGDIA